MPYFDLLVIRCCSVLEEIGIVGWGTTVEDLETKGMEIDGIGLVQLEQLVKIEVYQKMEKKKWSEWRLK